MRKALALAAAGAFVCARLARRRRPSAPRVVVGYADGSTLALAPGSPERELLIDAAAEVLQT